MDAATETAIKLFEGFRERPGSAVNDVKVVFCAAEPRTKQWIFQISRQWSVEQGKYITAVAKSEMGFDHTHIRNGGRGCT